MAIRIDSQRLAYMALPKAACSTVKRALAELDPAVDIGMLRAPRVENGKWHVLYPTRRFRPHRWGEVPEDWFRFTVVRDPVKRLFACYTNRVVTLKELHNSPKIRSGEYNLPTDPDPDYFFQNIEQYKLASSAIKHHALHTWLFTGSKLEKYTKVHRVESLTDLATDLSEWTGEDVTIKRENKSTYRLADDDLSPETWDALRPWLKEEYDFLKQIYPDAHDRVC